MPDVNVFKQYWCRFLEIEDVEKSPAYNFKPPVNSETVTVDSCHFLPDIVNGIKLGFCVCVSLWTVVCVVFQFCCLF